MTPSQYEARLGKKNHGVPVPLIRDVIILLDVGELASEEDDAFLRWVHNTGRLSIVVALKSSADKAACVSNGKSVMNSPN